jgi:hypothetical protein
MIHEWRHSIEVTNSEGWLGDPAALISWAMWAVDSLFYLSDLDARVQPPSSPGSHSWEAVDLAHARWAAASSVGAIDLCAAALSRRLGLGPTVTRSGHHHEYDLDDLKSAADTGKVVGSAAEWADAVWSNRDVQLLTSIRHPTTHSRLRRHFIRCGGGSERTHLIIEDVGSQPIEIGTIVALACDTATAVVEDFLDRIAAGKL